MPVGYTEMYARKLDDVSRAAPWWRPRKAQPIVPGTAYLAPAGRHLTFVRAGAVGR